MKTLIQKTTILLFFLSISSCSKDDNNTSNTGTQNLGAFSGNFQVSDDPQTNLGYVFNSKVIISTSGAEVTLKMTGNEGLDRTFTGNITSSVGTTSSITITKQTLPVDKSAAGTCVILGNELSMTLNLANDNVTVRALTTSTTTFNISGKILLLGTGFIKQ